MVFFILNNSYPKAICNPINTNTNPLILLSQIPEFGFPLILAENVLANSVKITYQITPIIANVIPNKIKGTGSSNLEGVINCGKNAKKNNATLGFKELVKNPDQKSFLELFFASIAVFSVNKADLERLNIHKWLSRLTDYLHIKNISDVPSDVHSFENFNRRQKAGSPDKHIRRRMKRHNETFEQASLYFSDYKMAVEDKALPFLKMKSVGSDNDFIMSIIR